MWNNDPLARASAAGATGGSRRLSATARRRGAHLAGGADPCVAAGSSGCSSVAGPGDTGGAGVAGSPGRGTRGEYIVATWQATQPLPSDLNPRPSPTNNLSVP